MYNISIIRRKIRQRNRSISRIAGPYINSTIFRLILLLFIISTMNSLSVSGLRTTIVQSAIFVAGTCVAIFLSNISVFKLKPLAIVAYLCSIGLLVAVLIFGSKINGACRWLRVGGFTIQPSEFVKPALIFIAALYLDLRDKPSSNGKYTYNIFDLLIPLLLTIIPLILILKQPDLGTGIVCFLIIGSILFFMKIEKRTFFIFICLLSVGSYVGWHHMKAYQKERIVGFLNPDVDYHGKNWQSHQSLVAFGSGGMFGKGMFSGPETQLGYLPENESDFAMASIGEEHGFVVACSIIIVTILLVFNLIKTAYLSHDRFSVVFSIGMAFWIGWQSILNMLMILGCIPVVGIPYPVVSSGGSSLLSVLTSSGILISISRRNHSKGIKL